MRRHSLIFRDTLLYAMLFVGVLSGALAFLYWSSLSAHETELDSELESEAADLFDQLAGLTTVTEMAAVVSRTTDEHAGRTTVYMLATASRQYVAGNLRKWPHQIEKNDNLLEFPLDGGTPQSRARGLTYTLPAGHQLLVAQNVQERTRFRKLIRNAFIGALLLTGLLGVGGAYVLSRRVAARLDEINRNSEAILEGNLDLRMPESGRGDEFDELAHNLNRMLDRIGSLMAGIRGVTDDIAHDMRSPISRLRSRIEVALLGRDDPQTYRLALEKTIEDADAILTMFNSLLTIAHAESGEPRKTFETVDLGKIVRDVVETYEPAAEDSGISLHIAGETRASVLGNPHLLGQAITNLLDNALKYVPAGGNVWCAVENSPGTTQIVVRDDGPGVPASFYEKAFDRFSRLETSRSSPGSGLGLSLVRAIVQLHEGEIRLSDGHPGLVITLELPAEQKA